MGRLLCSLLAVLSLSACVLPSLEYRDVAWQSFVKGGETGRRCDGTLEISDAEAKPYFLVTSRLPDCQKIPITLTVQRSDQIRYGRFGRSELMTPEKGKPFDESRFAFQPEQKWRADLAAQAEQHDGRVLIYVHGYNEIFSVTANDTADIAEFTGFDGPVVHYSWPSRGALLSYTIDENNADFEEEYFAAIVNNIALLSQVKEIVLLSHSMGARLAIPAIEHVDRNADKTLSKKLKNIIIASPDYDRGLFVRKLQSALLNPDRAPKDRKITVYASREDIAVGLSRIIHGYARLGNPKCDDPVAERNRPATEKPARCYAGLPANLTGLEIIDTTSISSGTTGHNDFLRTAPGCADLAHVVAGKAPWPGRITDSSKPNYVWQLSKEADASACKKPKAEIAGD